MQEPECKQRRLGRGCQPFAGKREKSASDSSVRVSVSVSRCRLRRSSVAWHRVRLANSVQPANLVRLANLVLVNLALVNFKFGSVAIGGAMANARQMQLEWSMLPTSDWSISDLQLAAELGKTLLERNKELESQLRQHQNVVEDQSEEIEYLRKQTAALREVNDSRLRIYEQLEISIAELETNNHRLNTQSTNDKKHIANLENQIEKLESRCEELLRKVEDYERARNDAKGAPAAPGKRDAAEMAGLKEQLSELRTQNCRYVSKLQELQTTIDTVTQENLRLEETVLSMQRKQDEMTVIDQVRQGQICRRCLRATDDMTSLGDEDDVSIIDSLINDDSYQSLLRESLADMSDSNPYRTLVEKYEALLEVQAAGKVPAPLRPAYATHETSKCLSLQEELAMSGFSSFHREEDDGEYEVSQVRQVAKSTPDFSETETSSSGFADETMNKGTQTEATVPGAFLCSITDGDDCKFSIYDEASPIETRFRKTPEYKKLFREIFDVLKRAAEAKDEGETLPLLEDQTPMCEVPPKVPPVTPLVEDVPEVPEAGNSSGACAEQPSSSGGTAAENAKRDILESLTHGVGGHKKSRSRRRSAAASGDHSPVVNGVVVSTKVTRRKNKDYRQRSNDSGRSTPSEAKRATWCGDGAPSFVAPAAAVSSASHDVARLKQLEKSYAEVLRLGRQQVNRK